MIISTQKIFKALEFFTNLGYVVTDVPLVVDEEISNLTKPNDRENFYHTGNKVYVASAEQSFLQMMKEGVLPCGRYIAITPCVRDEEVYDETHFKTFLKVELCCVGEVCVKEVVSQTLLFNSMFGAVCSLSEENSVVDINLNGIEVGSYGVRTSVCGRVYTFGTAIAEPRFSYALSKGETDV